MSPVVGSWWFVAPYGSRTRAQIMKALIDTGSRLGETTLHRVNPGWTGNEQVTYHVLVNMDRVREFEQIAGVRLKPLGRIDLRETERRRHDLRSGIECER